MSLLLYTHTHTHLPCFVGLHIYTHIVHLLIYASGLKTRIAGEKGAITKRIRKRCPSRNSIGKDVHHIHGPTTNQFPSGEPRDAWSSVPNPTHQHQKPRHPLPTKYLYQLSNSVAFSRNSQLPTFPKSVSRLRAFAFYCCCCCCCCWWGESQISTLFWLVRDLWRTSCNCYCSFASCEWVLGVRPVYPWARIQPIFVLDLLCSWCRNGCREESVSYCRCVE